MLKSGPMKSANQERTMNMKITLIALSGLTFLCACALTIMTIINAVRTPKPRKVRSFVKSDDICVGEQ